MAKKRTPAAKPAPAASVTAERFVRLYRLVQLLSGSPLGRDAIARRLRLDVRGFYRDLDLLRSSGVTVSLESGRYALGQEAAAAFALLPFPDPRLTLGAAQALAKGRGPAHRALSQAIQQILPS